MSSVSGSSSRPAACLALAKMNFLSSALSLRLIFFSSCFVLGVLCFLFPVPCSLFSLSRSFVSLSSSSS
ncbi:hypothetical protein CSUI_007750, partial [Cystoisospora suis]